MTTASTILRIPNARLSRPFEENRDVRRPFAITARGGATGNLVQILRFAKREDAEAFYQEHAS